jgi:hypothetical protein
MLSVPLRAAPVFAATLNVTVPLPLLVDPDVIVNHDTLLAAAHGHSDAATTAMGVPAPPPAPMF